LLGGALELLGELGREEPLELRLLEGRERPGGVPVAEVERDERDRSAAQRAIRLVGLVLIELRAHRLFARVRLERAAHPRDQALARVRERRVRRLEQGALQRDAGFAARGLERTAPAGRTGALLDRIEVLLHLGAGGPLLELSQEQRIERQGVPLVPEPRDLAGPRPERLFRAPNELRVELTISHEQERAEQGAEPRGFAAVRKARLRPRELPAHDASEQVLTFPRGLGVEKELIGALREIRLTDRQGAERDGGTCRARIACRRGRSPTAAERACRERHREKGRAHA